MLKYMLCFTYLVVLCINNVTSCRSSSPPPPPATLAPSASSREAKPAPGPNLNYINPNDHGKVTFTWNPIKEDEINKEHPMLAIKVKMWPAERVKLFYYKNVDGETKLIEKYGNIRKSKDTEPETEPLVLTAGPNDTSASTSNSFIKTLDQYWAKTQAVTDLGDGPYSKGVGLFIVGRGKDLNKKMLNTTSTP